LAGITAHNLGVLHVLALKDDEAIPLFQEAIDRKRQAFGLNHPEVAISLDEIGIQYFAREKFSASLEAFQEALRIRALDTDRSGGLPHASRMAMVLNNIACCHFQMGQHEDALRTLQEAREILNVSTGSSTVADLDLLHVAITNCNYAYLLLRIKKYDEARSIFEEALLVRK
jgi:tetratricopeptide (TPR) repeat protein